MNGLAVGSAGGFEGLLLEELERLQERVPQPVACAQALFRDVGLLFSSREVDSQEVFLLEDGRELLLPCGVVIDTLARRHEDGWFSALSLMVCADGRLRRLVEWFDATGCDVRRTVEATSAEAAVEVHGLPALLAGAAAQALRLARAGRGAMVMDWVTALQSEGATPAHASA